MPLAPPATPNNVLEFQAQPERYRIEHLQTPAENHVWHLMYLATNLGKISKRFTLEQLLELSSFRARNTIRTALAGLVRKRHVTVLDRKGYRHHGTLYRVQFPSEILALQRDAEYLAEQERLAREAEEIKRRPKPKQQRLAFDIPQEEEPPTSDSLPDVLPPAADPPSSPSEPDFDTTECTDAGDTTAEIERSKCANFDTSCCQNLTTQKARILFPVLNHEKNMENMGGGLATPARMRMREPEASVAPAPQPVSSPAKAEGDSRYRNSSTTVKPEDTPLGRRVRVLLKMHEVDLDHELRAKLCEAMRYFAAKKATPEELEVFHAWRFANCKTEAPPLLWLRDDFNRFRLNSPTPKATGTSGGIAPPKATGTGGRGESSRPRPANLKAQYEASAAQMFQAYVGKHWESVSEKLYVFKGYVLRAGLAWNDDLANEIFC